VKIVNAAPQPQALTVHIEGASDVAQAGTLVTLQADSTHARNSLAHPHRVVPHTQSVHWFGKDVRHVFPPYSISVLKMHVR